MTEGAPIFSLEGIMRGVPSTTLRLALLEKYETIYNIFNHDPFDEYDKKELIENRPLAVVAMHDSELICRNNKYDKFLSDYLDNNVLKYTGLNFQEYLKEPLFRIKTILDKCKMAMEKEINMVNAIK